MQLNPLRACLLLLTTLWLAARPLQAAPGDLDLTFDGDGKVTAAIGHPAFGGGYDTAQSVLVQSDGKIIAAGWSNDAGAITMSVARYHSFGALDTSFGVGGVKLSQINGQQTFGYAAALQSDGKIVVAGSSGSDFAVARFNSDGTPDNSFGSGGAVVTNYFGSGTSGGNGAYAVAIQTDGKIVAAGQFQDSGNHHWFTVVRYNPNGSLDTTFNSMGSAPGTNRASFGTGGAYARGLVIQSSGKIVLCGYGWDGVSGHTEDLLLMRFTADGLLDTTFGSAGKTAQDLGGSEKALAIAQLADGKLVTAGSTSISSPQSFLLMRFNTDGFRDSSFGSDGAVVTPMGAGTAEAACLAIQNDGKIVAGGYAISGSVNDFALARFQPTGVLDPSFGSGGRIITSFGSGHDQALALALQPEGNILLGGVAVVGTSSDLALARYRFDGPLITTLAPTFPNSHTMTLSANLTAGPLPVGASFEYGFSESSITSSLTASPSSVAAGATATVTANLTGFPPRTLIYYRAKAVAAGETSLGNTVSFTTPDDTARLSNLLPDGRMLVPAFHPDTTEYAVNVPSVVSSVTFTPTTAGVGATLLLNGAPFSGASFNVSLLGGLNTATLTVVAQNGFTTRTYTLSVFRGETGPGGRDGLFGAAGIAKQTNLIGATAYGVAVAPDGKIVTVGADTSSSIDVLISRFNADGSPDTTFSGTGYVSVGFAGIDLGHAVAVQPDGKIIAVGEATVDDVRQFIVVRYLPEGDPDLTFGGTGYVLTDIGTGEDVARGVALQSDGSIVVCGSAENAAQFRHDFAVVRYLANGTLDSSFGTGGKVVTSGVSTETHAYDLALQNDGKIVVAGNAGVAFFVCRYLADGTLDTTFSGDGKASTQPGNFAYARSVALQSDGRIVLGGMAFLVSEGAQNYDFALARFLPDGSLDTSFNGTGSVKLDFQLTVDEIYDIAVQVDGSIVAAGITRSTSSPYGDFALARFLSDGTLDTSFVDYAGGMFSPGKITTAVTPLDDVCRSIALLPDGKIIAAGYRTDNSGTDSIVLASYHGFVNSTAWRLRWFGSLTNTGNAAFTADPDHDGIQNHLEYAFGLDPTQHSSGDLLPQWWLNPGDVCELRFDELFGLIGTTFVAEWSTTLDSLDWHAVPDLGTNGEHRFLVDPNGAPAVFFRLKVNGL